MGDDTPSRHDIQVSKGSFILETFLLGGLYIGFLGILLEWLLFSGFAILVKAPSITL